MDFSATIDLIIKELKEAGDIIDDLKKYPGIPSLQVELARLKCKSASEVIAMLKTLKDNPLAAEKDPLLQKKMQKRPPAEPDKPSVIPENVAFITEKRGSETNLKETEPLQAEKEAEPKKTRKKEPGPSIVADKFSSHSDTLIERMENTRTEEDIADALQTKHIASLSEAIGVNDRFIFIREIFNGNQDDYSQAISRLENAESLSDARAVIMSYTGDNAESEAIQQLLDLVKRKLPANE